MERASVPGLKGRRGGRNSELDNERGAGSSGWTGLLWKKTASQKWDVFTVVSNPKLLGESFHLLCCHWSPSDDVPFGHLKAMGDGAGSRGSIFLVLAACPGTAPWSFCRPLLWYLGRTGGMAARPGDRQVPPRAAGLSPAAWSKQQQGMPSQCWQHAVTCNGFALHSWSPCFASLLLS